MKPTTDDFFEYLDTFKKAKCGCGRSHDVRIPKVIVGATALDRIAEQADGFGAGRVFVLADPNTFRAAGEEVVARLEKSGRRCETFVFSNKRPEPDEETVREASAHVPGDADLIVAVGSGVINDIGKVLASRANLPYFSVATAPSMDGYASSSSSLVADGLKVSVPTKCAEVVFGDTEVLRNAPIRMLQAGLGDMLAKYVSVAEWRISHEITGEYFCDRIAGLMRQALDLCVKNADGLLSRDEEAVRCVFEGLIVGGVAMSMAGVTRPASGIEHYFSHIWDMRGLAFGTPVDLHGIQCGAATNVVCGLYEELVRIRPDREKAASYVKSFDYPSWKTALAAFVGKGADAMIALEEKERKYSVDLHAARWDSIVGKWETVCRIVREEIPPRRETAALLDAIGAPKTPEELGIVGVTGMTLKATKDIRDKYILSRLLWDLGVLDDFAALSERTGRP